jgi:3-oxoacyl-[acyl-carrier-protein] synthase-3
MAGGKVESVRIVGIGAAVPEAVGTIADIEKAFGEEQARRVAKSVGVEQRHLSRDGICTSDLCYFAAKNLLEELQWKPDSIDAIVFVSATPDYFTPATACVLQQRLGLSKSCAAFDINHGCAAYAYGLWVTSNLIGRDAAKRALVLVGDTPSRHTSPFDRSLVPLVGDAGAATALEWDPSAPPMYFEMGADGGGAEHFIVKAGAFRHPHTPATPERIEREDGTVRSDEDIYMNGAEIFAFSLREVPPLTERVLGQAGWTLDDIDSVVMHQANLFIIQHLAKKMRIPKEKVIENLTSYGNVSGATIPLAISEKMADQLRSENRRLLLLAFGVGLSWGGVALHCGPVVIPKLTIVGPKDL